MRTRLAILAVLGSYGAANADDRRPPDGMPRLAYETRCTKAAFTWAEVWGKPPGERSHLLEECLSNEEKAIDQLFETWPKATAQLQAICAKEWSYPLMAKCIREQQQR